MYIPATVMLCGDARYSEPGGSDARKQALRRGGGSGRSLREFLGLGQGRARQPNPWRDSEVDYEHGFSAISLAKNAEPTYNPYYAHRLTLIPYWHVGEFFAVRGRFILEQELTNADDTTGKHEVVASDLTVDTSFTGVTEPYSGIKFKGGVRWLFPTSKASQAQTLQIGIGPGVSLERSFPILEGLTISYAGRILFYINRYTSPNNTSSWLAVCGNDISSPTCGPTWQNGGVNPWGRLIHGPEIRLASPPSSTSISAGPSTTTTCTPPRRRARESCPSATALPGRDRVSHMQWVLGTLSYTVLDYLSVSLGFSSKYGDLAPGGSTGPHSSTAAPSSSSASTSSSIRWSPSSSKPPFSFPLLSSS